MYVVMATFSTSSQVHPEKYDVFISFRGPNVRNGFLSHLTPRLTQGGINVFVDENNLESGNDISSQLIDAIKKSKIALVIFSEDYASSKWCLEELEKIMECKRLNSQIVIPIFYKVDPSHVRYQKGSYADAFTKHGKYFKDDDLKKLQIWRSILKETADLSGHHFSNNIKESDLIDRIIEDLLKKLKDKEPIEPKIQLIGFEKNLATIESFMKSHSSKEVGILGISGKRGIGKTTLARVVFDKFSSQFDRSWFVPNVREESKKIGGLTCLLRKTYENLTMNVTSTSTTRSSLSSETRFLLVFDDVDTSFDLQKVLKENILRPRSIVIVTSENRHDVRASGGVQVVYHEVEELNEEDSLQLFCWHAFGQDHPKRVYEKLSMQAIQYVGGLPLALKVLGSYLKTKDTKKWNSALKNIKKRPNNERIQTVLTLALDGLDGPEKMMFLDIAFFFKGEKKKDVIRMINACADYYTNCGIENLIGKALITISRDNTVELHDLLQEMAKEVVYMKSIKHPERRSRLNDANEIEDVLKNNKGTSSIESIILECETLHLTAESFQNMSNLRFLKIQRPPLNSRDYDSTFHHLPDGLNSISNNLRYFYWEKYPFKYLPLGFCPKNLVEIHLKGNDIEKLWDGVEDLWCLKVIDLSCSRVLKELPDFSDADNLEIMDLTGCVNLRSIHSSILSLPKLVSLNLSNCSNLENLHVDHHMKSLKHLTLTGCETLKELLLLPSEEMMRSLDLCATGIETLKSLEHLTMTGWLLKNFEVNRLSCLTSLKKFSLSNFEGIEESKLHILFDALILLFIEELHLKYCMVSEIPDNISSLSSLKILSLRGSKVKKLPTSIKYLSKLKEIDLCECELLESLPDLPPSTTHFYVSKCRSLETVDFTLMRAIYNNRSCEVKVCYPGSTFPKGFSYYSQMAKNYTSIELASPSSSNHLLGFACCCIISPSTLWFYNKPICRKLYFDDEEINYKDEKEFPCLAGRSLGDHVLIWYDPIERILNETQRRQYGEGTAHKFACEFFLVGNFYSVRGQHDNFIKACGLRPIYASELQRVQQTELQLSQQSTLFKNLSWEMLEREKKCRSN